MKSRKEQFERIRKIKDEIVDIWSLDKSQWEAHTDFNEALAKFEQSYNRVDFVKEEYKELDARLNGDKPEKD